LSGREIKLVWNKGIAAPCDRRIPDEFAGAGGYVPVPTLAGASPRPDTPDKLISTPDVYFDLPDGTTVWVRLAWLKSFVRQILPRLRSRIVLITGDSDSCTPSEAMPEAQAILESPQILHWYAQNYDGTGPEHKISPIPIGIDFHTLSERSWWGEARSSPQGQEFTLRSIRATLPPRRERIPLVYIDFAWQGNYVTRHLRGARTNFSRGELIHNLRSNRSAYLQGLSRPRSEMWRTRGQYVFVMSPHGNGLDCHRTWEALALGHIVLVQASSLDPVFQGLPVVPITSYHEITRENLATWSSRFETDDSNKLTSAFWVSLISVVRS
jgi:hypothetical protein